MVRPDRTRETVARDLVAAAHAAHQAWPLIRNDQLMVELTSAVGTELAYLSLNNEAAAHEYLHRADDLFVRLV